MIKCEKDLEDYICNNQEKFITFLEREIYAGKHKINFIGRQVKIGNSNIADLIYYSEEIKDELIEREYIIVELKFRELKPKDLAQLSRYINVLQSKLETSKKYNNIKSRFKGAFLSLGMDQEMKGISILYNKDIFYFDFEYNLQFCPNKYKCNEFYIQNLELDQRIDKLYKEK